MNQSEIAEKCGCSRATVNAVLSGRPQTQANAELTAEILRVAEEGGYWTESPSMASIGRDLGLTHVTVRAALREPHERGMTKVSDDTVARVRAHAEKVGYKLPPLVRRPR